MDARAFAEQIGRLRATLDDRSDLTPEEIDRAMEPYETFAAIMAENERLPEDTPLGFDPDDYPVV